MNSTKLRKNIIIEIEKYSNQKWEYDRTNDCLFFDRVLPYPYFYPYAYGFFPNTLGNDGDELDVLLISDSPFLNYNCLKTSIDVYIVGGLMMYDEKGADEKIFVVPVDEIDKYNAMPENELQKIRANIKWFFSNYKLQEEDKWSRVDRFLTVEESENLYSESVYRFFKTHL
jgi:inorganic pyrophosphatase